MIVVQFTVGGSTWRRLALGVAAGLVVWFVFLAIKILVVVISARCIFGADRELMKILYQAHETDDSELAVSQLQDLMEQRGESFYVLLALAESLREAGHVERAAEANSRAKGLADGKTLWLTEIVDAEIFLVRGRPEEAHTVTSRLIRRLPMSFNAHLTHAKATAELGDLAAAEASLEIARSVCRSVAVRMSAGWQQASMMRRDLHKAERQVSARSLTHLGH